MSKTYFEEKTQLHYLQSEVEAFSTKFRRTIFLNRKCICIRILCVFFRDFKPDEIMILNFIPVQLIILLAVTIFCGAVQYACNKTSVPCGCGQRNVGINARIVNGEDAVPLSWPMIVSLRDNDEPSRHFCGGTILTESYILTAAHCVNNILTGETNENLIIVAGVFNLSQSDEITRQVDKVIVHPLWSTLREVLQYDIAILHLAQPLDVGSNSTLSRTCLPPRQNTSEEIMNYPSNGTSLVNIGWGSLEYNGDSPDILQQVTLKSINHLDKICANTIRDPSIHFCAGLYEGGKGRDYVLSI